MSENTTKKQSGARSFEERVIAMLNGLRQEMNARFDKLDERVAQLEAKSGDAKPIWEQALVEILETQQGQRKTHAEVAELRTTVDRGFRNIGRKLDVFNQDLLDLRDGQRQVEE